MLLELQRLHDELSASLDQLELLTNQTAPPMDRLPAVRLALTRASRSRTMLLERLHADLVGVATPADKAALEQLRAEAKDNLVRSAHHIGSWSLREVTKRWPEYCQASEQMRAGMRQRIARERRLVYPLLSVAPRRGMVV
jgi:hypothetical protein